MTGQTRRAAILALLAAACLIAYAPGGARGQSEAADPVARLMAGDPDGRRWLAAKEAARAGGLSPSERLDVLRPWAERYSVPLPGPLQAAGGRPASESDLSALTDSIDDAVRRSVAAKAWTPMGEVASWEAFLARHGFRLSEEGPSPYILGAGQRIYRRAPRLPQAVHTILLATRSDRPGAVFSVKLRYTYPPEVARRIEELEGGQADYERALALRLPALQADRPLLEALGRQALAELWPSLGERWGEFIDYLTDPAHVASRARVLAKKNPPTISEVRLLGDLAAHLYEFGPSGWLELAPQGNALDVRGNPLYGARRAD